MPPLPSNVGPMTRKLSDSIPLDRGDWRRLYDDSWVEVRDAENVAKRDTVHQWLNQADEQRMSLRTGTRRPARFRDDDVLTFEKVMQPPARSVTSHHFTVPPQQLPPRPNHISEALTQLPRLDTAGVTPTRGRGRPRKRRPSPTKARSYAPKKPRYPPAAFPSMELGTVPPTAEEKRKKALEEWAIEDDSGGRWGECWSEVGPYAEEREVVRAVEGRAKRACYWHKKTVAEWYYDEMLEQSRREQGLMHWTRRGNIIHVLEENWRWIAKEVFGEEAEDLEDRMREIYIKFWN
ncbi:hypothetical protein CAC42_4680 [Sphaceloma murrayae]|uniref:Uncharacterized protein n=1 Tax=Sphaceloma murrayae TaxID=2082308 RepID=A0A2K1QNL5_9PEZI|nr:hypothetical protein CAC42_4680 [Sphaceloma murrayae]